MFHYLKQYRTESILGPLFKLLEAAIDLIVPLVVARIVDQGIRTHDLAYILRMGGFMIALGVIGLAFAITAQYFAAKCLPAIVAVAQVGIAIEGFLL